MRKAVFLVLVCVLVSSVVVSVPTSARAQTPEDAQQAEKIKQQAATFGDGARVSLRLRDKKKITGHINYLGKDSLVITDARTKASLTVAYSDVAQIERKEDKGGFPRKAKIALGILGGLWVMGMIANGGG